jgi:hypothetical protein
VYLVVFQCDVVLVHVVPLLDADLLGPGADLRRDELLEVTDGVVLAVCEGGGDGGELGTVRFGRSGRLGFPQGAHRGEKGGAGGHEGVGCVDTHLHLTRIFLPRRSLSTTSIMRAVAYPSDGAYDAWKCAPRVATSTFCHDFPKFRRSRSPNEVLNGQVRPLRARATIMRTRSALLLIALLLGCLLGARAQATVSFSPTSAFPNRCARVHSPASSP